LPRAPPRSEFFAFSFIYVFAVRFFLLCGFSYCLGCSLWVAFSLRALSVSESVALCSAESFSFPIWACAIGDLALLSHFPERRQVKTPFLHAGSQLFVFLPFGLIEFFFFFLYDRSCTIVSTFFPQFLCAFLWGHPFQSPFSLSSNGTFCSFTFVLFFWGVRKRFWSRLCFSPSHPLPAFFFHSIPQLVCTFQGKVSSSVMTVLPPPLRPFLTRRGFFFQRLVGRVFFCGDFFYWLYEW